MYVRLSSQAAAADVMVSQEMVVFVVKCAMTVLGGIQLATGLIDDTQQSYETICGSACRYENLPILSALIRDSLD